MIRSFKNSEAEALFGGRVSRRLQRVARVAQRKLQQLHALASFETYRRSPAIGWKRWRATGADSTVSGVNDQYRICFVCRDGDAEDVEIVDYP